MSASSFLVQCEVSVVHGRPRLINGKVEMLECTNALQQRTKRPSVTPFFLENKKMKDFPLLAAAKWWFDVWCASRDEIFRVCHLNDASCNLKELSRVAKTRIVNILVWSSWCWHFLYGWRHLSDLRLRLWWLGCQLLRPDMRFNPLAVARTS